jgi:hypothetical protein
VVVLSINQVWYVSSESFPRLKQNVEQPRAAYQHVLETYTEPDAMVFAAGTSDKHVALFRRTVGIWTRNPSSREIGQLSDVAAALSRIGRPLYIVAPAGAIDLTAVRQRLHSDSLYVEQLATEHPRIELLRVSSPIQMLSISEGVYEANIPVLNDNFAIAIEWDGLTNNNIANPSFEYGLDGWRGPDGRIRVEHSNEVTFSGRYSLKFAMEPGADNYEFARRTYSVDVKHLKAESWLAFGRVMASGLSDSQGEMRVYLRNESEQVIERHLILVTEDTHGFQTIGLGSRTLPNDAKSMSLQLGLRGFSQDSAGTIYWDGMELVSGFSLPKEHCQGSDGECSWIGSSELVSGRMGDIESMKVKLDNGRVIDVGGPFYINDRLLFRSNQIFLERGPSTETHLADLPSGPTHGSIALQVISVMPPKMRITPIN